MLRAGTIHELNMPNGLGQFTHIADTNMMYRNFINKTYWYVKQTKWIKIANTTGTDKQIQRVFTIKRTFKNDGYIRCDLDAYNPGDTAPNFYENVSPHQLEWLIITPASNFPSFERAKMRNESRLLSLPTTLSWRKSRLVW